LVLSIADVKKIIFVMKPMSIMILAGVAGFYLVSGLGLSAIYNDAEGFDFGVFWLLGAFFLYKTWYMAK